MFWKKKGKSCERIQDKSEKTINQAAENEPQPNRRIIDGKLYGTSRAKNICDLILSREDIPNFGLQIYVLGGQKVTIYRGVSEWFIEYSYIIEPVTEDWVRKILGEHNVEKYIELFGEVEEA